MLKERIMGQRYLLSMYIKGTVRSLIRVNCSRDLDLPMGRAAAEEQGSGGNCVGWIFIGGILIQHSVFLIRILASFLAG